jgi:kumamolisin
MVRKSVLFLLAIAALVSVVTVNSQAQSVLTHHVRDVTYNGQAQPLGRLPANQIMQLNVVLPLSDQAGLDAFLKDLYDPSSPSYHQYLSVAQFTERFGPSQEEYDAVVHFAQANGFTVVGGSHDGMDVQIKGPVSSVEKAFHVNIHTYQHPTENRTFYAPDSEPTTSLPFPLWHVSGMDNYSIPRPLLLDKKTYAQAHGINSDAVVSHATTGSGPSASFLGSDMRAAYYGGTTLTGAGQNLGLLEYEGTDLADLNTYFANVGQTNNVPITLFSTDGTSTSCVYSSGECDDTEQTLDMTQAIGVAPGLASLVMYIGSTDTAMISAMTTHNPLPTTISCSWTWTPVDPNTLNPYFERMATQGQNFFTASGDDSTWKATGKSSAWPADNAYIVSVGGTDLTTSSANGAWQSETAWADSGGGISPDKIAIPAWQQLSGVINSSNKGSTTYRNGPDVSANANFTYYTCADQEACLANEYGGTSFAAPIWAAYTALVNQQLASMSQPSVGFLNPIIYAQNVTSVYHTNFHDITSGTSGSYSAVSGYDLVTGWGSPNGTALINALAPPPTSPTFSIGASPGSVSVVQGSNGASTITTTAIDGFDSGIALTASGQPTGVTVGFNPTSIAAPGSGTSSVTLTVASNTVAGTYPITITGTGGGVTQTAKISLTVTALPPPAFTISVSPTSLSITQGSTGHVTVTTSVSGGFSAPVSLAASALPSGVTGSFNPTSIAAPGSGTSTYTLTVSKTARTGTSKITLTGKSGTTSHTTTFTLDVLR